MGGVHRKGGGVNLKGVAWVKGSAMKYPEGEEPH